jgi:hypothetical protein
VLEGQVVSLPRLIRAAGLRWPAEESFELGKGCFGLESQARLYIAIIRHTLLVMAALAICAITAALLRRRTDNRALPPVRPDQPPPAERSSDLSTQHAEIFRGAAEAPACLSPGTGPLLTVVERSFKHPACGGALPESFAAADPTTVIVEAHWLRTGTGGPTSPTGSMARWQPAAESAAAAGSATR